MMNAITDAMQKAQEKVEQSPRPRVFKAAVARAYITFAREYPEWAQYLFDDHFLTHHAAPILADCLQGLAPSVAVARVWAEQMTWPVEESRQERIAQLTLVVAHFLELLEAELQGRNTEMQVVPQSV